MTSRPYAEVIGDPIAQSKSPLIHNFWLGKLGIDAEYRATLVGRDGLADYLAGRRSDPDWRGCNVTMPLKLEVVRYVEQFDDVATRVGAANLIHRASPGLAAGNTDVGGILDALPEGLLAGDTQVCLIGAGGAARAALAAFALRGVEQIALAARDSAAGRALLAGFGMVGELHAFDDPAMLDGAGLVVNATPLGMRGHGAMPEAILAALDRTAPDATVLDMVYDPIETELLARAQSRGLLLVDGLHMLVGQAALAFEQFFGQPAPRQHDAELRALLLA